MVFFLPNTLGLLPDGTRCQGMTPKVSAHQSMLQMIAGILAAEAILSWYEYREAALTVARTVIINCAAGLV